ncbi:hypothetical protein ACFQIC_00885 [Halobacillus seohaensis]|uniref:DUF5590 domain-containing protein n=2 Tax=Halobacillus seohaensis TaxID=447421 RepID=A0ABW2EJ32_9BACI
MKMIGTQPSSRFTVPSWVRWILLIIGVLFIIMFSFLTWMYLHIEDSRTNHYDDVRNFVESENILNNIEEVVRYNGESPIYIVNGEGSYLFVDLEANEVLATIASKDMIGINSAQKSVTECNECELIDTRLAYEENRPVWEVTYTDESNRYVFEYIDLENGREVQRFAFRQAKS